MAFLGGLPGILASGTTAGLGTAEQQRARQDAIMRFGLNLAMEREKLEESKRQHDLQYGSADITLPPELGGGKVSGPRWAMPSILQGMTAREREISPEEINALQTIRERIVNPQAAEGASLEAQATEKAFPQFKTSPLTVDIPQGIRLPRQTVATTLTEAAQIRKEQDAERRANAQRKADARFRELYDTAVPTVGHNAAQAKAIQTVQTELGIAPSREAFVTTPKEVAEPKFNLEQRAVEILGIPEAERTTEQKGILAEYVKQKQPDEGRTLDIEYKKLRNEKAILDKSTADLIDALRTGKPVDFKQARLAQGQYTTTGQKLILAADALPSDSKEKAAIIESGTDSLKTAAEIGRLMKGRGKTPPAPGEGPKTSEEFLKDWRSRK